MGISSLLASLIQAGHETALLDFTYAPLDQAERLLKERLAGFEPGLVGISVRSFEWDFVRERLLPALRREGIPVVVGGPHPTAAPEEVMAEAGIDFLVQGEGEAVLLDIVQALESGSDIGDVDGCWQRLGGGVRSSEARALVEDLDSLPVPYWGHWDRRHFADSHSRKLSDGIRRIGALESSRGCPYSCPYCITPTLHGLYQGKGKYHREKSVDRIISEALAQKEKFGLDYVNFIDETFLLRTERVAEFSEKWRREVGIPFRFTTRPETVSEERIRLVAAAGASLVGLGIESGDPEYRRRHLNRGYSQEQVRAAVEVIKRHDIKVFGFFVVGMPGETRETIENTLDLIWELKLDHYMVSLCYPFRGTPFYDVALRDGLMAVDKTRAPNVWEDTPLSLPGLPRERLVRLRSLVSYFARKDPRWRPLMRLCEKNPPVYNAWRLYRKLERKIAPSDIL